MIRFRVNGAARETDSPPMARLLDVLRVPLGLTGTKEGCGEGECGACSVLIDGVPVNACLVAVGQCEGADIVTVEGLAHGDGTSPAPAGAWSTPEEMAPLQQCFVDDGGAQCGICTPGMLIAAEALLRRTTSPTDDEIRDAIAGNLCRCTGYQRIVNSIKSAAALVRAKEKRP